MILRRSLARLAILASGALLQGCLYVELYGPVSGASVTIAPLRGGAALIEDASSFTPEQTEALFSSGDWAELTENQKVSLMGAVELPKDELLPNQFYLITASGGLDYDYNSDQQRDATGEPVLGTWHAILTGRQLKGITRVSVMTEAVYRYLLPDLDDMSNKELQAALDDAAQRLVEDINNDDVVDYKDVVSWTATAYADRFRGEEFLLQRLRTDIEYDLSADSLDIDAVQLVERAPLKPAVEQSPLADDLVYCLSPIYFADLCSVTELPLIGTSSAQPTVADLMERLVVSHDWMATRFEQFLEQMPATVLTLARSVSAIVISDAVRPAYFDPITNAVYLDPDFFWLTDEEYATVSEEEDYRSEFSSNVNFSDLARYVRDGESVGARAYEVDEDGARTLEQAVPYTAAVLFHEFSHASDAIAAPELAKLNPWLAPFQQSVVPVSTGLTDHSPLLAPELYGLAGVLYQGWDPTPEEAEYTPKQVATFFASDRANDLYGFSTPFEDLAMLVEEFMMATHFQSYRDVGFTNAPTGATDDILCDDYVIAWGQRNRIAVPRIRARLEYALTEMLPDMDFSSELAALPAPKNLPASTGWCSYLDQLADGVRPLDSVGRPMERPLPTRARPYE